MIKKKILILILISFFSTSHAKVGDNYYCQSIEENTITNGKLFNRENSEFSFKRYKNKIIFDGGSLNQVEMDIDFDNGEEYFAGVFGGSIAIFLYHKNIFMFTMLSTGDGTVHKITNVFANCKTF